MIILLLVDPPRGKSRYVLSSCSKSTIPPRSVSVRMILTIVFSLHRVTRTVMRMPIVRLPLIQTMTHAMTIKTRPFILKWIFLSLLPPLPLLLLLLLLMSILKCHLLLLPPSPCLLPCPVFFLHTNVTITIDVYVWYMTNTNVPFIGHTLLLNGFPSNLVLFLLLSFRHHHPPPPPPPPPLTVLSTLVPTHTNDVSSSPRWYVTRWSVYSVSFRALPLATLWS